MEISATDRGADSASGDRAEIVLTYCASSAGGNKFSMPQPKEEGGT